MVERNSQNHPRSEFVVPVEARIPVPGLTPEVRDPNGKIILNGNLDKKLDVVEKAIEANHPWYKRLSDDVQGNKKSAIFVTALGGLVVFAAAAAGYEFGVRHGRDIRELNEMIKRNLPGSKDSK